MFIFTAKVSARKIALGAVAVAAVVLAAFAAANLAGDVAAMNTQNTDIGSATQEESISTLALTNDARIAYLQECGWEVDADSCVVQEVIIPSDFDETYQSYADLQARQGFELEKYKGKRVKQVTYTVMNYPENPDVIAELLIYRGNVIAGDICSMQSEGGFTRSLMDHPQTTEEEPAAQ